MPKIIIDFTETEHGLEDARQFVEDVLRQMAPEFSKHIVDVTAESESDR